MLMLEEVVEVLVQMHEEVDVEAAVVEVKCMR